jgi:hypothetical protein
LIANAATIEIMIVWLLVIDTHDFFDDMRVAAVVVFMVMHLNVMFNHFYIVMLSFLSLA